LVWEECEGDDLWASFDDEFDDIGMESTVAIDSDICRFFSVDGDGDGLWGDLCVVKRECRDTHESSCITIQVDDRSAVFVSIGTRSNRRTEDESCPFDSLVYTIAVYIKVKIIDKIFTDDDIVDSMAVVCVACVVVHSNTWKCLLDESILCYVIRKKVVGIDMVHEKADCSEIDSDERELVLVVELYTMEHEAIAASDEDCCGLGYIIGKTGRMASDIVLE